MRLLVTCIRPASAKGERKDGTIKISQKIRDLLERPSREVASGVIGDGCNSSQGTYPVADVHNESWQVERIDQIPINALNCGRLAREWGYELRLCQHCAPAFFPPEWRDNERVRLRGGDMCASCGYRPPDAQHMAIKEVSSALFRAALAGASRAQLVRVVDLAIKESEASVSECADDMPGWQPAATWPATW